MRFSCPYSVELSEDEGGCSHDKTWNVAVERDPATEQLVASQKKAACPRCKRPGVADSEETVVLVP